MNRITKILVIAIIFSMAVLLTQESLAAGFSKGNEIQTTEIYGRVTSICNDPFDSNPASDMEMVSCEAILWSPVITDHFVGPANVQADQVALHATRADGSQKKQSAAYDGTQGISKEKFNLGIRTLTQSPLLRAGQNNIHYILSQAGAVVTEGQFTVNVTPQQPQQCGHDTIYSIGPSECRNHLNICRRYFERNNYCQ